MRGGGDPVRGVQESQNPQEGVNSSQIFQDKGAEPSLGGQHDARALGHGVVIGMPGGDTLASVRVRGPGLVAEVVDLSHRLDSWQVDGEAGGQGTLREMERHQHNLSRTRRVSISFSQTNHDT